MRSVTTGALDVAAAEATAGLDAPGPAFREVAAEAPFAALAERIPDALVVTDAAGRVRTANPAFLDLIGLAGPERARGRALSDWLDARGQGLPMVLAVLKSHGSVRSLPTVLRDEGGRETRVDLSAALAPDGEGDLLGFIMRPSRARRPAEADAASDLKTAVRGMTDRIGSVSLPELVRDTTTLVERHFIQAALELTGGNRTTAADLLGLSRQSLYVKLRRCRMLDLGAGEDGAAP